MDINLEKIELVKDRTGVSYNEAKEALENADGSVVDAIVAIEDKVNEDVDEKMDFKNSDTFRKIKELVERGNVSQIKIKRNGVSFVNFPVTIGVLGVVLVPWVAVIATVTALGSKCEIELIDHKGVVIDINEKASKLYDKAKETAEKGIEFAENYVDKEKVEEVCSKAKEYADVAKTKGEELVKLGKEKAEEYGVMDKVEDIKEDIKNKINDLRKGE